MPPATRWQNRLRPSVRTCTKHPRPRNGVPLDFSSPEKKKVIVQSKKAPYTPHNRNDSVDSISTRKRFSVKLYGETINKENDKLNSSEVKGSKGKGVLQYLLQIQISVLIHFCISSPYVASAYFCVQFRIFLVVV